MITKKQIKRLKEKLDNGEFPLIPDRMLHIIYNKGPRNWSFLVKEEEEYLFEAAKELGFLSEKGGLTKLGWYYVYGDWYHDYGRFQNYK